MRISTSNPILAEQFESAMEFWSGVLDLDWHEVDSDDCAIQLVDGTPSVFDFCSCLSARSQLPDRPAFQGWIAFNPRLKLTRQEMFLDAVHEIGHLFGLTHNPNDSSVMFAFELDKAALLDAVDLAALASRHQLRPDLAFTKGGVRVTVPNKPAPADNDGDRTRARVECRAPARACVATISCGLQFGPAATRIVRPAMIFREPVIMTCGSPTISRNVVKCPLLLVFLYIVGSGARNALGASLVH